MTVAKIDGLDKNENKRCDNTLSCAITNGNT